MKTRPLTDVDYQILHWYGQFSQKWVDQRPPGVGSAKLGALVRRGLLVSTQQSECVRGEKRAYWTMYRLTVAGRAALEAKPDV